LGAQGGRQRRAGDESLPDRGDVRAAGARLVEHDLQEIGRPAIDAGLQMRDRGDELFSIAGAGGNDGTTERERAAFQNPPAWRQMIREAVDDDLATGDAG